MPKYTYPTCPSCDQKILFRHGLLLWNPWHFKCPHCSSTLETTKVWKAGFLCSFPAGLLIAAISIYQEQQGLWTTADSLMFFFIVFVVLVLLSFVTWPFLKLKVKNA